MKKTQNSISSVVFFELLYEASVFFSIFLYDFVTVEESYRIMLKVAWRMTQLTFDFSDIRAMCSHRSMLFLDVLLVLPNY